MFIALEAEVIKAELAGKSVVIEMHSNSKLRTNYIPNYPNPMSQNGKILSKIIDRNALIVANGSVKCVGNIIRERRNKQRTERSCIDIVVFSGDLNEHLNSLLIDYSRKHVLTRIIKTKKGGIRKESDHNVQEFSCHVTQSDKKN